MNRTLVTMTTSVEGAVDPGIIAAIVGGSLALIVLASGWRVIKEYQRGVVLRFGRRGPVLGPGLRYILPLGIDRLTRVDLRSAPLDVPPHEVITHDGVPVRIGAAVHVQVLNPLLAVTRVLDYEHSTRQLVHAGLRDVVAATGLRELLLDQPGVREALARFVNARTEPWGISATVDLEDIVLPEAMQRAMARHAQLRGEQPTEHLHTESGADLAEQLEATAKILAGQPRDVQTRFLQALAEVHSGDSTVVIVPLPTELIQPFVDLQGRGIAAPRDSAADLLAAQTRALPESQPQQR
jgi:regulator of protease activity HflC (stomatin/prohibitin superfamily)